MSTLKTTYLQHPSATSPNITLNSDGTIALPAGAVVSVHYVEKTDTWSAASVAAGGNSAVTGLSLSNIAVADASNYLLITASIGQSMNNANLARVGFSIYDGSSFLTRGNASGNRTLVTAGGSTPTAGYEYAPGSFAFTIKHAPGSTSSKTYSVYAFNISGSSQTLYVNRPGTDSDSAAYARSASTLTIMEIAG